MTPTAIQLAQLRRMINEPTSTPYADEILSAYITKYPLVDINGVESGTDGWVEDYDLHAAAADVWEEKAAIVQALYDFSADGGSYSRSQLYEMAMDQARFHTARRKMASRPTIKTPSENDTTGDTGGLIYDETYAWWRP